MPPKTDGILESSLYVSDVPRSVRFYEQIFGFQVITEFDRGCALHAGTRQVLLLFKKGASRAMQSPHDGDGELHVAFAIPIIELENWELWLQTKGIEVEEKRESLSDDFCPGTLRRIYLRSSQSGCWKNPECRNVGTVVPEEHEKSPG